MEICIYVKGMKNTGYGICVNEYKTLFSLLLKIPLKLIQKLSFCHLPIFWSAEIAELAWDSSSFSP